MKTRPIQLCLLAGRDNRFAYLERTIAVSRPYFGRINLVDTGSTDQTATLASEDAVHYRRLYDWRDDWAQAYHEAMLDVPFGEWFLFLDSDERPSQLLLENLQQDVTSLEREDCNIARLPSLLHLEDGPLGADTGSWSALLRNWPATHTEFLVTPCWTKSILVRRLPDTFVEATGGHCSYRQRCCRAKYLPRFYNHYKTRAQLAASAVLCSWSFLETHDVPVDHPAWTRHNQLREKFKLFTAGDLVQAIASCSLPAEMLDFWRSLKDSPLTVLRDYWRFAFEFDFLIGDCGIDCDRICCHYPKICSEDTGRHPFAWQRPGKSRPTSFETSERKLAARCSEPG